MRVIRATITLCTYSMKVNRKQNKTERKKERKKECRRNPSSPALMS
jgi:hypothetical protein